MDTGHGVKGLITNNDEFLVLVKPDGKLDLPGGRVELGETHEMALHRETKEETRLQIDINHPIFEWSFYKKSGRLINGTTYYCRLIGGKLRLSNEHLAYYWTTLDYIDHPDFAPWFNLNEIPNLYFKESFAIRPLS